MIISHKYKFIFIHVPKTGGTSIKHALIDRGLLDGKPDWRISKEDAKKYGLDEKRIKVWVGHLTAREQKKIVGEEIWNSYFKFAFVRNPWERTLAAYKYMLQNTGFWRAHPLKFLCARVLSFKLWVQLKKRVLRQNKFLSDKEGNLLVDFVGRFENLQEDFNKACDRIGVTRTELPHVNKSEHKHYSCYYDKATRDVVEKIGKEDNKMFGYTFEGKGQ